MVSWSATLDAFMWRREPAWLNQHIFKVVSDERVVDKRFHFYLLKQEIANLNASEHLHGSTMKHINRGPFLAQYLGLPPLEEQKRIGGKLDILMKRSGRVQEELAHIPRLLERYKQAVVNDAFSGILTHKWREAHRDYNVRTWHETKLGDLLDEGPSNGWSPPTASEAGGALTLKLTATTSGYLRLDTDAVKRIHDVPPQNSKYWLEPGDLLIQRANSIEFVGAAAIFDGPRKTYIYPDLMMRYSYKEAWGKKG